MTNIVIIGAGYVGGCTAAVMSKYCPTYKFTVLDVNASRIAAWNSDNLPIRESGLDEIVSLTRGNNLYFTADNACLTNANIVFICVNTPIGDHGYDMHGYREAAKQIAQHATNDMIIVEKSTVPVRAAESIAEYLHKAAPNYIFNIVSNPEFLAEGTAIRDLEKPARILIGGQCNEATNAIAQIYSHWTNNIIFTNLWSAELAKLAANAMLAQRISSINALSALCEQTGADIGEISNVLQLDPRIGSQYLCAGIGFGGSCFRKDLLGLIYLCDHYNLGLCADYWRGVLEINEYQRTRFCTQIIAHYMGSLRGINIAVFGIAFKKNTSDLRESIAVDITGYLCAEGAHCTIYDPMVSANDISAELKFCNCAADPYTCADNKDCIIVLTDWDEFTALDWARIRDSMAMPTIFDGRRLLSAAKMRDIGFMYHAIGSIKN